MFRVIGMAYGVICYLLFLATCVYAAGFLANHFVPSPIDSIPNIPRPQALLIDLVLLGVFMLQQGIMTRPFILVWMAELIPARLVFCTRMLCTSAALMFLFKFWEPLGGVIWQIENGTAVILIQTLFVLGWCLVASMMLTPGHLQLAGLSQAWAFSPRQDKSGTITLSAGIYRPLPLQVYTGWLLVLWSTPNMTLSRLTFSLAMTGFLILEHQLRSNDTSRINRISFGGGDTSFHPRSWTTRVVQQREETS